MAARFGFMRDGSDDLDVYERLANLPDDVNGEVIEGVLHVSPRPSIPHVNAQTGLAESLGPPFRRGKGGPGGWVILVEPELRLGARPEVLIPDLAGWRRERLPELPDGPYVAVAPDWVCEVLSPSTQRLDRGAKLSAYRHHHVAHVWLVDPSARLLEVLRLAGDLYQIAATFEGDALVRAEPFETIELDLASLWAR